MSFKGGSTQEKVCFWWNWNVNKIKPGSRLKICDSAEGPGGGTGSPPVTELAVLSRPQEVLTTTVVRVLVEGPVALHDVAGVDVTAVEVFLHWLTVLAELHHLPLEVGTLVNADAVGALAGLEMHSEGQYQIRIGTVLRTVCLWF